MAKKSDKTEDKIVAVEEALSRGEQFFEKNKNLLFYILLGILVVVGGIFLYNKFILAPKEREAQSVSFYAEMYFEKDSLDLAINGDGTNPGFLQILDDYGSTKQGNLAKYYLGICYLKKGEFKTAIDYLKDFDADDHIVAPMAIGATGDAYMELGDTDKAIEFYLKAVEKDKNDFTTSFFMMKAAWAYETQNKYDKALELYEIIKKEHHKSYEARDVEKYIAYAKGKSENK
ncbi:MAG: tetratricopeptide repeat protein [Bacteroidales bacterium]|jgi:tetratricopeptide (TPR) repeat protein|nr:tetratricopeptide repeat protein [Bacteroidales bacterium]